MPLGSRHQEIGRLRQPGNERVLQREGGGTWRLDMGLITHWRTRKLVGKRVQIAGERIGFDVLSVERIKPLD